MHGQTGTTSNLLAIAVTSTIIYKYKNMVTQTHFNLNNLEAPLLSTSNNDSKEYFMDIGIDALARSLKSSYLDSTVIENCTISLLHKQLSLLPGTTKNNKDIYEFDMSKTILSILNAAANCHDIIFIDTNSGRNDLTMKILNNADIIVVNLSQNKNIMDDFTSNYNFNDKKIFYLIGNYDPNSKYNYNNLRKIYRFMKKKNTAVIPYNTEFMDVQSDGEVISYIMKNLECKKEEENAYFIKEVKLAVNKLLDFAGLERRDKNGFHN